MIILTYVTVIICFTSISSLWKRITHSYFNTQYLACEWVFNENCLNDYQSSPVPSIIHTCFPGEKDKNSLAYFLNHYNNSLYFCTLKTKFPVQIKKFILHFSPCLD